MPVGDKDTYEKWLGPEYVQAYEAIQCNWGSHPNTAAANVFIHPLLPFAGTLVVLGFSMFFE